MPDNWDDFQSHVLSHAERKRALEAYYQHADHTAWRYLAMPNLWMHDQAAYVIVNPQDPVQRWSAFEEYQPLIVMLFLAANDKNISACDGYDHETRLTHFIAEIALLGRAHNWDDTRVTFDAAGNPLIEEEYDDLEGDRPSCYSGVKRRLFQSVQGHPIFKLLTQETIKNELRDFLRLHFKESIHEDNREALKEAWNRVLSVESTYEDLLLLKTLDIPIEKQTAFIQFLAEKYAQQFTDEPPFKDYIQHQLHLKEDSSHASKFGHVKWDSFLEQPLQTTRVVYPTVYHTSSVYWHSQSQLLFFQRVKQRENPPLFEGKTVCKIDPPYCANNSI